MRLAALFFVLSIFTVLGFPGHQTAAFAQEQTDSGVDLQPLIDNARENGLSVIVISPEESDKKAESAGPTVQQQMIRFRSELRRIFSKIADVPDAVLKTFARGSPDGSLTWLLYAFAIAAVGIGVGTVPSYAIREWTRKHFAGMFDPNPKNRAAKVTYLMFRAFMILVNLSILGAVAVLVVMIFDPAHGPSYGTIGVLIGAYVMYRVFRHVIFFNLITPDSPTHRLINLDDEAADQMQREWRVVAMLVIALCAVFVWLALIGLPADPLKLLVIVSLFLSGLLISFLFIRHKQHFQNIILGAGDPLDKPGWRKFLASQWHILMVGYLVVAWMVSTYRVVLDVPGALAVVGAPVVAFIGAIVAYGLMIIFIDRFYENRKMRFEEKQKQAIERMQRQREASQKALEQAMANRSEDDDEEMIINQVMTSSEMDEMPAFKPIFKITLEEAAGMLSLIGAIWWVLGAWDVNIGERGNPVTGFMDTILIVFFAWFLYRLVIVYINNQLEQEGEDGPADTGEPGEEMSGKSASRLATLLPLLRNVLVACIIILSGMIILSNMGVDIAPLFAGAGVIGLAVGFGAQTLIRDIFSGGFFLFDDAFRKGEYIELGDIRGTVEKISLRSFQLRHHNGPLHTIPFGEITQLTNYSRDWVMMKLPLRLTYDTDVERVRKLVKKLGQRLLEHPEVGSLFLQPLKSQGVYTMEDSAMIIRVKFMTKPGDQFVTRKVVYAAIRELFEQENIKFANKEVTVRLADETKPHLEEKEKQAVAAAARRIADDEAAEQDAKPADDGP